MSINYQLFEAIYLQYPYFFKHVAQYCTILDITRLYQVNKELYTRRMSKDKILWMEQAYVRYKQQDNMNQLTFDRLSPVIRPQYYDLCKLVYNNKFFFEVANFLYPTQSATMDVYKGAKHLRALVSENDSISKEQSINHIELMLEHNMFIPKIVDILRETTDKGIKRMLMDMYQYTSI